MALMENDELNYRKVCKVYNFNLHQLDLKKYQ